VAVCYNARQDNTIQYSTIKYNKITHLTHKNIQHATQPSISIITIKNQ
jgi:hypothetical protein